MEIFKPTHIVFVLLFMLGCSNRDIDINTFSITEETVEASTKSVSIRGAYDFYTEVRGMKISIGREEDLSDAIVRDVRLEGRDFSVYVDGLSPYVEYYYRYVIDFGLEKN